MSFAEFLLRAVTFGTQDLFDNGLVWLLADRAGSESVRALWIGLGYVLTIAVAYLLGSINTALIISRRVFHDDVRKHGSGNAGTTNVLRTYGKKAAGLTFLGDMVKGIAGILFACLLFGVPNTELNYWHLLTAVYMAAFFAIIGHVFPCFSQFRGGKGFATAAGVILALNPVLFLILFCVYVPMVLCSHYISLSSVVIALFYPMLLSIVDTTYRTLPHGTCVLFAVAIGALITWAHRGNLRRIYDGNERKFYLRKKSAGVTAAPVTAETDASDANAD